MIISASWLPAQRQVDHPARFASAEGRSDESATQLYKERARSTIASTVIGRGCTPSYPHMDLPLPERKGTLPLIGAPEHLHSKGCTPSTAGARMARAIGPASNNGQTIRLRGISKRKAALLVGKCLCLSADRQHESSHPWLCWLRIVSSSMIPRSCHVSNHAGVRVRETVRLTASRYHSSSCCRLAYLETAQQRV